MALHESKGQMYEWVTDTWNTIKGECPHGCTYCYMHQWGKQKPVRLDTSEFKTDFGSGKIIFVGSSCDMFACKIPAEWIIQTLDHCSKFDNTYLFQTKNPKDVVGFGDHLPSKSIICTTIETNRWYPDVMKNSPPTQERASYMKQIHDMGLKTYVTIEPIMDFDLTDMVLLIKHCRPEQVNIGADSRKQGLPEPSRTKLLFLISELQKFTTIAKKINLERLLKA